MPVDGKNDDPGRGQISPEDRAAFQKRAHDLEGRLNEVKSRRTPQSAEQSSARGAAMGQAMKIAVELVVGVGVGGFIGWVLDRQFGTAPWLLVLFLIAGFAAGMLNVIRTAQRMQAKAEPLQRSAPSVKDDEDDR